MEQIYAKLYFDSETLGKFKYLKKRILQIKTLEETCFGELKGFVIPITCFKYMDSLNQIEITLRPELQEEAQRLCEKKATLVQDRFVLERYLATEEILSESCKKAIIKQIELLKYRDQEI
jgi:hypothetical protein